MDWYKIISNRTPVRTKDSATFGYVADQYKDSLVVIEGKNSITRICYSKR